MELTQELQQILEQAADLVKRSSHVVALSGAGLSVESGIPPYRGPGGLWTKFGQPPMLSYQEFDQDPKAWWESRIQGEREPGNPIYEMKLAVDRAAPNQGHLALVELKQKGLLKCTVTQNVDNLHREAGGVIKMDTVMFGEPIPPSVLQACREQAEQCDCMLLVGTSGTVNPAARLPLLAKEAGAALIEINPEATGLTPSGEILPLLADRLLRGGGG